MLRSAVAIVGAGPVGLATALRLATLRPHGTPITLFEKRSEYVRSRWVLVDPPLFRTLGIVNQTLPRRIRLNALEKLLADAARQRGIILEQLEVTSAEQIPSRFTEVYVATGSKGVLRDKIFGPVNHHGFAKRVVSCVIPTTSRPSPLPALFSWYPTLKVLGSAAHEMMTTQSAVLLWEPEDGLSDAEVRARLRFWVNVRDEVCGGRDTAHSVHWSSFVSETYSVSRFSVYVERPSGTQIFYAVGDAALGVPYFESLNQGLRNLELLSHRPTDPEVYHDEMTRRARSAVGEATSKSSAVDTFSLYLRVSRWVPWQINRFSPEEVARLSSLPVAGLMGEY